MKFKIDIEGVALDAEPLRDLQRLEVRTEAAVWTSRDRDVLAVEEARVALRCPGLRLDERVVRIAAEELFYGALGVQAQHALIVLTWFHLAVAVQDGFQIHGQIRVTVPTLKVGVLYF